MPNNSGTKFILSSIYAGLGLGLLIGMIMGLSVSPTVKIVLTALATLLGALLGLENKLGKSESDERSTLGTNVKLGSFGFAVVAGMVFGITARTNYWFAPSLSERVVNFEKAGYDSISARNYVLYEHLGINPVTGETTLDTSFIKKRQMLNTGALFKSSQVQDLSTQLDPDLFNGDIQLAISRLKKFENKALNDLLDATSKILPENDHMNFLTIIQQMTYKVEEGGVSYCQLPQDIIEWNSELLRKLSKLLVEIDHESRGVLVTKIKEFFCTLE